MPTIRIRQPLYKTLKEMGERDGLRPSEVADDLIRTGLRSLKLNPLSKGNEE